MFQKEADRHENTHHILKVLVVHAAIDEDPVDVSIIIEGNEVLIKCDNTAKACTLLIGLLYALNLEYPAKLKYTFEVFQKTFSWAWWDQAVLKSPVTENKVAGLNVKRLFGNLTTERLSHKTFFLRLY